MEIVENIQHTAGLILLVAVVAALLDPVKPRHDWIAYAGGLTLLCSFSVWLVATLILIWS